MWIRISDNALPLGDCFCSGEFGASSSTHVQALADELEFKLKEARHCADRVEWAIAPIPGSRFDYETVVRTHLSPRKRSSFLCDRIACGLDGEKLNMTFEPN
ncbi:hypothetical protein [Hominenteromicrobium sp.]|uniref:hypothetical protein n=1 Tax=Hominenteromicrobium sp. TaxID=3073581 RepID=UPI00399B915C